MLPSHRLVLSLSLFLSYALTATAAVSLADFAPRIDGPLPSRCDTVYNQKIDGCVPDDFDSSKQRCSAACVSGLVKIMQAITNSCSLDDVSETSIIGVFLLGNGIPILCKGVSVTTIGQSSSTPPAPTSTQAQSTVSRQPAVQRSSSTEDSSPSTSTSAAVSSTVTQAPPSSAAPDPSFAWNLPSTTSPPNEQPTPNQQKSNSDSGGGSPFDVVASAASQPQRCRTTTLVGALISLAVFACTII